MTLRKMTAADRLQVMALQEGFEKTEDGSLKTDDDKLAFCVELVARSVVNAEGVRQFDSVDGREWLSTEDAVMRIWRDVFELNGLSGEAEDCAKKN